MERLNKLLFGIIGLWTCLAVFFGFFDLYISKIATINNFSLWSELGDVYGNKFDDPLLFLAITTLIGSIFNDIKMQRKIGFIMGLYAFTVLEFSVLKGIEIHIFIAGIRIIFLLVFLLLTYDKYWRQYVPIAISLILLTAILDITVDTMKILWGRTRFNYLKSDTEFTPWYIMNGNGYEGKRQSFPSGHTATAWSFLPLLYLLNNKKMYKQAKILLVISVLGFGLFVAVSRVLRGAHYASDVLFSTGIAAVLTIILYKLINKIDFRMKEKYQNLSNPLIEIKYSHLADEWLGIFKNERGQKIYTYFKNYEDAVKFSSRINSLR